MSFINTLIDTSIERSRIKDIELKARIRNGLEKKKKFEEAKARRLDDMMVMLTEKYHPLMKNGMKHAAHVGLREKYMNFVRDDFKANFPTLGTPPEMARMWLYEMTTEDSKYIPFKDGCEDNGRDHFKGLEFDVWNNRVFTVKLTW